MQGKNERKQIFDLIVAKNNKNYPTSLLEMIENPNTPSYEVTKLEYLLEIWAVSYRKMTEIQKSMYINSINKILKGLYNAFLKFKNVQKTIVIMYFQFFKNWNDFTRYLSSSIQKNQKRQLIMLWKITFNFIQFIKPARQDQFAEYLSNHFQEPLSKYKYTSHQQKIYILQIIKHINSHIQFSQFINNREKWAKLIRGMFNDNSKTGFQKNDDSISLYNYQKTLTTQNNRSRINSGSSKSSMAQISEKLEVTPFMIVENADEEQQIYKMQIIQQIIQCKSLLVLIDHGLWHQIVILALNKIQARVSLMDRNNQLDMIYANLLKKMLEIDLVKQIVQQRYIDSLSIKVIENLNHHFSAFRLSQFQNIFISLHSISLIHSLNQTSQAIISKRIKGIIYEGLQGKDHILNRSLMQISCKYQIKLQKFQYIQIVNFLTNTRKKAVIPIETFIIVSKILLSALKRQQRIQFKILTLFTELPGIVQFFLSEEKINKFRNSVIQVMYQIIRIYISKLEDEEIIVKSIFRWFKNVEINTTNFLPGMMKVLYSVFVKYQKAIGSVGFDNLESIINGMTLKLSQQPSRLNTFLFVSCLIEIVCVYNWLSGLNLFQKINPECFRDQSALYQRQAELLFKDKLKQKQKAEILKKDLEKNQLNKKALKKKKNDLEPQLMNKNFSSKQEQLLQIIKRDLKEAQMQFNFYIGEKQIKQIENIINGNILFNENSAIGNIEITLFQFLVIKYSLNVEKIYQQTKQNNKKIEEIVSSLDENVLKLFMRLYQTKKYIEMFEFAAKLFSLSRNFFHIISLKSYQFLKEKCFQILSSHFNRDEVLSATAFFCSLMLPYISSPKLQQIYDILNREEFFSDLLKGSNQFIAKQKKYHSSTIIIFLVFWLTEPLRKGNKYLQSCMVTLRKNVIWWKDTEFQINTNIGDKQSQEQAPLFFQYFRMEMKKILKQYYSQLLRKLIEKATTNISQ